MSKIAKEVAEAEIEKWLDFKKILAGERERNSDTIALLVDAIMEGALEYDESTNKLKHYLLHPFQNEQPLTELTYLPRINDNMLQPNLRGVSAKDGDARLIAVICTLTGQARGIIQKLDSTDKRIALSIAVFFL